MGSSRSEMQCPEFESPMDHQKERTPDRVCVLSACQRRREQARGCSLLLEKKAGKKKEKKKGE